MLHTRYICFTAYYNYIYPQYFTAAKNLTRPFISSRIYLMKIPTYWVTDKRRGSDGNMWKLRGISYTSMQEARERLEKRYKLRVAFTRLNSASKDAIDAHRANLRALDELKREEYSTLLLEPIIEQIDGNNIITRNRYGVRVLNSTSLCFIDVDNFPLSLGDRLRAIFGKKQNPEEKLLQTLRQLCETNDDLGARVYRTHNGWRIMLTGAGLAPDSARMHELCRRLHADPLYESLCARQQCWRARLSPKPYRVGVSSYPRPVDSEALQSPEAQAWLQRYEAACNGKSVCRLVDSIGRHVSGPEVELHDSLTGALLADKNLA